MRLALAFGASLAAVPVPIGAGPAYRPPALGPLASPAALRCTAGPLAGARRVHVELFARRRAVVVPAGVGVGAPRLSLGRVVEARCRAPLRTLDPTGVVEVDAAGRRLGAVFATWRMPLRPNGFLTWHGRVTAFVGGRRWRGDPRRIPLRDHAEIVLELGGYVPPHRTYGFPPR